MPWTGYNYRSLLPYMVSSLAQAFAVRRWGDAWGQSMLSGGPMPSSLYRGHAWTLKNYLIAGAAAWVTSKVVARTGALGGAEGAKVVWRAFVENTAQRLLWTEVFARWDWGKQNFGALPPGCRPGDVERDANGNVWLCNQEGQWVSMQGPGYGNLVQAGPLGYGELVKAGPLGHDVSGGFAPLGHLMSENTSDARSEHAAYLRAGSKDPFAASMFAAQ